MKTRLSLKVTAGSRTTGFARRFGDAWKLHVSAPPVDGKANDAITRFLAGMLDLPNGAVRIISGLTSSRKTVEIEGISAESLERAILESHGPRPHPGSTPPREA
jgi:uncharacterized protein YggU (UPF0235/DUF167 family)